MPRMNSRGLAALRRDYEAPPLPEDRTAEARAILGGLLATATTPAERADLTRVLALVGD